jgi:hypothetical protein
MAEIKFSVGKHQNWCKSKNKKGNYRYGIKEWDEFGRKFIST